jgi:hypothetical protein
MFVPSKAMRFTGSFPWRRHTSGQSAYNPVNIGSSHVCAKVLITHKFILIRPKSRRNRKFPNLGETLALDVAIGPSIHLPLAR